MSGLIDGDIIAYRCAASAEQEPVDVAIMRTDSLMKEILDKEDTYMVFLSGPKEENFRYKIYPEYKANRKDKPKPKWLATCEEFLKSEYNAIVTHGYEADDALGINQTEDSVIYTIDKDLNMIPGHHYNFVKKEYFEVSPLDGLKFFYKQMLIGDTSDNIKGIDKIGPVKAAKLIDHLEDFPAMENVVYTLYNDPERFKMNANLLWIMRNEGETYSKRMDRWAKEEFYHSSAPLRFTEVATQI